MIFNFLNPLYNITLYSHYLALPGFQIRILSNLIFLLKFVLCTVLSFAKILKQWFFLADITKTLFLSNVLSKVEFLQKMNSLSLTQDSAEKFAKYSISVCEFCKEPRKYGCFGT